MSKTRRRIYLESRYRKLVRDLPQTVFFCPECKGHPRKKLSCECCEGRGKLSDDSVQELLARRLLPAFRAKRGKFHGAGREDVDVLMLGRGRPFVFELEDPRREDVDLVALLERFHSTESHRVQCDPFRIVERERVGELKEAHYSKRYQLAVEVGEGFERARLEELVGRRYDIAQRTPQRVAHRRADLVRERQVELLVARDSDEAAFELEIETTHGTYVKEWVSGDDGRTEPSLASELGCEARCARLDVLEILTEDLVG